MPPAAVGVAERDLLTSCSTFVKRIGGPVGVAARLPSSEYVEGEFDRKVPVEVDEAGPFLILFKTRLINALGWDPAIALLSKSLDEVELEVVIV